MADDRAQAERQLNAHAQYLLDGYIEGGLQGLAEKGMITPEEAEVVRRDPEVQRTGLIAMRVYAVAMFAAIERCKRSSGN